VPHGERARTVAGARWPPLKNGYGPGDIAVASERRCVLHVVALLASVPLTRSVPALTVVAPVYVFGAVSVSVPLPDWANVPVR